MSTIRSYKKTFAGIALAAVAALPLAACSSSDSSDSASSSSSSETKTAVAKPVARINALSGEDTAVKLDAGFTDALKTLGLTPGVVGDGKLTDGSLVFPITGGNVTYFKPGTAKPYVIGQIQHEGSGFSLEAGGTKVEITNLNVDPGASRVYGDVAVNGKTAVDLGVHLPAARRDAEAAADRGRHRDPRGHQGLHQPRRRQPAERHLQDRRRHRRAARRRRQDHRQHHAGQLTPTDPLPVG